MSTRRIKRLCRGLDDAHIAAAVVQGAVYRAQDALCSALAANRDLPAGSVSLGVHNCPSSETGSCYYNKTADPSEDDCLICHEPDERK